MPATKSLTTALASFETSVQAQLDKAKSGAKIDRKAVVAKATKDAKATIPEMEGLTLVSIIIRHRPDDFNVVKGPQGGTFKK